MNSKRGPRHYPRGFQQNFPKLNSKFSLSSRIRSRLWFSYAMDLMDLPLCNILNFQIVNCSSGKPMLRMDVQLLISGG